MPKRILATFSPDPAEPPLYFLGYEDDGQAGTPRWTRSRHHARWLDADEAELEARLLAPGHTGRSSRRSRSGPERRHRCLLPAEAFHATGA